MTQTYSPKTIVMTKKKRKRKITDFDENSALRAFEQRLINLDYKCIIQDTYEEFLCDANHFRQEIEKRNQLAKNN